MKKFKILLPIASVLATTSMVAPILSSCGCAKQQYTNIIPTDLLDIDGNTLKGLKEDADISKYDTLEIPDGVRIVEKQAFGTKTYNNVRRIIFNSGIKEIQMGAFAGLDGLLEIDLSRLTLNDCYQLQVENYLFGEFNDYRYVQIKMNDSWSEEAKKRIQSLFIKAGVPYEWFIQPSSGHITFDGQKENTTKGDDVITSQATISDFYAVNGNFSVILEKTGGSDGVLVNLDDWSLDDTVTNETSKTLTFKSSLDVEDGHNLVDGEYVTYRAVIYGKYMAETKWIEIIDGFKLTYVKNGEINPTKVEFDLETKDCYPGEKFSLDYTVYPKIANDKTVTWKSSDPTVISVNEKTGQCKALKEGTATITATTVNGLSASCVVTSKIDLEGLGFEFYGMGYRCYDDGFTGSTLVIPSTYNGYPVVGVGYTTNDDKTIGFSGNTNIKEVIFPESISYINENAFGMCSNLEKVTFADNSIISSIGSYAFAYCSKLSSINFGENTEIGLINYYAFEDCIELKTINLPFVYELNSRAFEDSGLTTTTEGNITYLQANGNDHYVALSFAYEDGKSEYKLEFHKDCEVITNYFMNGEYSDSNHNIAITLEKFDQTNIKTIGGCAFGNFVVWYTAYNTSAMPKYYTQIQNDEFTMPKSLYYIGSSAFACMVPSDKNDVWQHKFTKVTLNEGLKWISNSAFCNCLLSEISIPASVEEIGGSYYYRRTLAILDYFDSNGAFAHNPLKKIDFASNSKLEYIGAETFAWTSYENDLDLSKLDKLEEIGYGALCFSPVESRYDPFSITNESDATNSSAKNINVTLPNSIKYLNNIFGLDIFKPTSISTITFGDETYQSIMGDRDFYEEKNQINLDMGAAGKDEWYYESFDGSKQYIIPLAGYSKFVEALTYGYDNWSGYTRETK